MSGSNKKYFARLKIKEKYNKSDDYFISVLFFSILKQGKKFLAIKIFFKILKLFRIRYKKKVGLFRFIFKKIYPLIFSRFFFRIQHVGKIKYFIPVISMRKSIFMACRWLLKGSESRTERTFGLKLFNELVDLRRVSKFKTRTFLYKKTHMQNVYKFKSNLQFLKFTNINLLSSYNFNFFFNKTRLLNYFKPYNMTRNKLRVKFKNY